MNEELTDIFRSKKANSDRLVAYGFQRVSGQYTYETDILEGAFHLTVHVPVEGHGIPTTTVVDKETGEEYVLYRTAAAGKFVAHIRTAVQDVLHDIAVKCYNSAVYAAEQSIDIIAYVGTQYGDELEFLWKPSDSAVWRRKDTQKWYAVLAKVSRKKLGDQSDEIVEIIDLRSQPETIETLVDRKQYYPGWHMNKKHWYTIILDGSVPTGEICRRVDESYALAR